MAGTGCVGREFQAESACKGLKAEKRLTYSRGFLSFITSVSSNECRLFQIFQKLSLRVM